MRKDIDLEEELRGIGMVKPYVPPPWLRSGGLTSGKTTRKKPYSISRRWFGKYLLQLERFEGRCTVRLTDESVGYSKVIARATGLDTYEGQAIYEEAAEILSTGGFK